MNSIDLSPKVMNVMGEIEKVSVDMNVTRMLRARRDEILTAIGTRTAEPTEELLRELAELDDELGIAPLFDDPIDELRAELREEEVNQDELGALIVELTARGMFNTLWTTLEDVDGCVL